MSTPPRNGKHEPKFLLMYSPLQFAPNDSVKPDGSLSLPYIAGALRNANFDVKILDASVGDHSDDGFRVVGAGRTRRQRATGLSKRKVHLSGASAGLDGVGVLRRHRLI